MPPEEMSESINPEPPNQAEGMTTSPEASSVTSLSPQSSNSSLIQPALSLKDLERGIQPQAVEPSNIEYQREQTRSRLAIGLVKLLGFTILTILGIHIWNIHLLSTQGKEKINFEASKDVASQILSPLVTLTATGIGFYFGSRSGKDQ